MTMKKRILGLTLLGGLLIGATNATSAEAADVLNGSTEIGAEVVKGDVTLIVDNKTDFGTQPLSSVVDFGLKDINYTVADYSGTTNGFSISAKLTDIDEKRSLRLDGIELSDVAVPVVTKDSNLVGDNVDKVSSGLIYTGVTKAEKYTSTIEWNLTKATTKQISE